jgi:activating signal cointegrator complex subunit 3
LKDPNLTARRKTLIIDAARALDKAKMMAFDEKSGNLYVTDLGRVASHYYIQYTSVETYNNMLKQHMSESDVGSDSMLLVFGSSFESMKL